MDVGAIAPRRPARGGPAHDPIGSPRARFCGKSEFRDFVQGGRLRFDGRPAPRAQHRGWWALLGPPAGRGIFVQIESVRQLRGESTSQVLDARFAGAHGWRTRLDVATDSDACVANAERDRSSGSDAQANSA